MRVVVGASSFAENNPEIEKMFSERGIELVKNPFGRRLNKKETIEHLRGADGLLAGLEVLDEEVYLSCPDLKAISRIGIGMDNVDVVSAKEYGICVSNTPKAPTDAVAEMTVSALLSICHNIVPSNTDVHNGIWKKRIGKSISELKVFIIGYGNIGKKTAEIMQMLGAEVMVYDKYDVASSSCELEEGLKEADVISIHASGNEEIITSEMIRLMKDGVIILNSARGGIVNEMALYDAMNAGKVFAFWGDALWNEPYDGILKECDNAILTPHISTYTTKCRNSMERQAVENLFRDLKV